MRGFQLWIKPAGGGEDEARRLPRHPAGADPRGEACRGGARLKVIAGHAPRWPAASSPGPSTAPPATWPTDPLYLDVHLAPVKPSPIRCPTTTTAFAYVYEGVLEVGPAGDAQPLQRQAAGVLSHGERFEARAGGDGARFILLAARPLHEPVVQYGPFVMNTREEIEQALADYRDGRLAA